VSGPFEDWSADAERTYQAEPWPGLDGLRQRHLDLYRVLYGHVGKPTGSRRDTDGRPVVWPHQATLAKQLGVSEKTVKNLIADLRTPDSRTKNRAGKRQPLERGWLRVDWEPARDRAIEHRQPWHDGQGRWQPRQGGPPGVRGRNSYTLLIDLLQLPAELPNPLVTPKGSGIAAAQADTQPQVRSSDPDKPAGQTDRQPRTRRSDQREAQRSGAPAPAAPDTPKGNGAGAPPNPQVTPKGSSIVAGHTTGNLGEAPNPQVTPKGSADLLPFKNLGKASSPNVEGEDRPPTPGTQGEGVGNPGGAGGPAESDKTHRCSKCGKLHSPRPLVASYPHSGCGGLWLPLGAERRTA
jgi:hypothetical protein